MWSHDQLSLSDMVIEHLTKITSGERIAFWLMVAERPHSAIVGNSVQCEFKVGPALRKQREGTGSQIRISDLKAHPCEMLLYQGYRFQSLPKHTTKLGTNCTTHEPLGDKKQHWVIKSVNYVCGV